MRKKGTIRRDAAQRPALDWRGILGRRTERQGLARPLGSGAAAVSAAMLGAHAQVMSAAEWSIALRSESVTRADLQHALWTEHSLVKTYGPRGTVHLLPAEDLAMWTGALAAVPPVSNPFPPEVRLDADESEAVIEAIGEVLKDTELTLGELTEAIVAATGPWAGELAMEAFQTKWPRWRLVERQAANRGKLIFGPSRGRYVTYTHPRRFLPRFRPAAAKDALKELALAFLRAYGPATPQHFARWLSAPPGWANALFAALGESIEEVEMEGQAAFVAAGDLDGAELAPAVRLLPYFDAYGIASHPRALIFPGTAGSRALNRGQAGNYPLLLVDGIVAGIWNQRRSGKKAVVTVEAFEALTARQRHALGEEAERLGGFLGTKVELTMGEVTAGGHA
jgi:hypothetical protein